MITVTVDDPVSVTLVDSNGISYRGYRSMVHVNMDGIEAYLPSETDRRLVELKPSAHLDTVVQTIDILLGAIHEKAMA